MIATIAASLIFGATYVADLVRCYDGDTCNFDIHLGLNVVLKNQAVRLCDIDAPELRGPEKEDGARSRDALMEMIKDKPTLLVVSVDERDKYGRVLAWITVGAANINQEMVRKGLAKTYKTTCRK